MRTADSLHGLTDLVREALAGTFKPLKDISAETGIPEDAMSRILVFGKTMREERVERLARYLGVIR